MSEDFYSATEKAAAVAEVEAKPARKESATQKDSVSPLTRTDPPRKISSPAAQKDSTPPPSPKKEDRLDEPSTNPEVPPPIRKRSVKEGPAKAVKAEPEPEPEPKPELEPEDSNPTTADPPLCNTCGRVGDQMKDSFQCKKCEILVCDLCVHR